MNVIHFLEKHGKPDRRIIMKTKKIGGIYIGEILVGTAALFGIMAILMVAVNSVYPAWQ